MMYYRARHSWLLAVSVVCTISRWCPGESARNGGDGAPAGTRPSVHSDSQLLGGTQWFDSSGPAVSQKSPALPSRQRFPHASQGDVHVTPPADGTQTRVHRDYDPQTAAPWPENNQTPPALPGRKGSKASQEGVSEPPFGSRHVEGGPIITQRDNALKSVTAGCTDTRELALPQRCAYGHYDIPKAHPSPCGAVSQRYGTYDIPRSCADSAHGCGTQRHHEGHYDIPTSDRSVGDPDCTSERNAGRHRLPELTSSPSPGGGRNWARPGLQQPSSDRPSNPVSSANFDWLIASTKPAQPGARRHVPEFGAYNTVAGSRPRSSAGSRLGVSKALTFTLPHSLASEKRRNRMRSTLSEDDPSNSQRQCGTARRTVEIIDLPDEPSPKPEIIFDTKGDSRGFLAHLWSKMRSPSSRKRDAAKSQPEDARASCVTIDTGQTSAGGVSADSRNASHLAQRALPPLPVASSNGSRVNGRDKYSLGGAFDPEVWDNLVRRELSPHVLDAVLICEERLFDTLRSGSPMELLSQAEDVEKFKFFAGLLAHFAKGLNLTPVEELFIKWAEECSEPSPRCPDELLLEFIPIFHFITGMGPLQVPPAVKVLLRSGSTGDNTSARSVEPPVPAAGGTAVRAKLPEGSLGLFFHRISSDAVRRQTVNQLLDSWSQFITEIKYLLFFNHLDKSFDYPQYRTRFLVYAYTASALKLQWEREAALNPINQAVHNCFANLDLVRKMAHPADRGAFTENLRRNYLYYIRNQSSSSS